MDDGAWSAVAAAPAADLSQDDDKPQPDARGLVPVRVVIDRVAHQAYSEFQNLVEVRTPRVTRTVALDLRTARFACNRPTFDSLPGMNNNERRRAIVDLCSELRKQLCKLKMLLEWTADAEDVHNEAGPPERAAECGDARAGQQDPVRSEKRLRAIVGRSDGSGGRAGRDVQTPA
ncbi:MAG: hypothetical protein BJ554DRAFT_2291 [Olpidium bornovanus]|uniref:Mediator of RNA polymerase II transcription subunit 14 n=1 Tax=Olpidium bornovanus TaxID=278681 RepID=A0A8H7ZR40_9FUNG|nr:MAG: hypothetical protein BJ554DRAFT_2291 [Olpidium bornovanus]